MSLYPYYQTFQGQGVVCKTEAEESGNFTSPHSKKGPLASVYTLTDHFSSTLHRNKLLGPVAAAVVSSRVRVL